MRRLFFLILGTVILIGFPAFAAQVEPVQGVVNLNQGQGYKRIVRNRSANVGDRVMAGPSGSARIVYPDGCVVQVNPGAVVSVSDVSPCKTGFLQKALPYVVIAGIAGGVIWATSDDDDDTRPASP